MRYLHADWIFPVSSPPLQGHVLILNDDHSVFGIVEMNALVIQGADIEHYEGILVPGFVNSHCHLELSWAEGLLEPGKGLDHFITQLQQLRIAPKRGTVENDMMKALEEMENSGIVATADISNSADSLPLKNEHAHYFHTFVEFFGSDPSKAAGILQHATQLSEMFTSNSLNGTASITPHATYSVSDALFSLTGGLFPGNRFLSIHHQENSDENHYFMDGSGPAAERRKMFNASLEPFQGTGKSPIESISRHFDPAQPLLLVHNTVTGENDIAFAEGYFHHLYWCLCPNANIFIENRLPDIGLFRKWGCKITLGTDSLASNLELNLLSEMKTIQSHFPHIPTEEMITWATLNGASFLGIADRLGSFDPGKKPGVVWIKNLDTIQLQLLPQSRSVLIAPAFP